MKKRKNGKKPEKNNSNSNFRIYLFAFLGELLVLCGILTVFSLIIVKSEISPGIIPVLSIFSFAISAFSAGFIAVRPKRKNGITVGFISSLPVMAVSAAIIAAMNGGSVSYVFMITLLSQTLCSMAGGIAAANLRKKAR